MATRPPKFSGKSTYKRPAYDSLYHSAAWKKTSKAFLAKPENTICAICNAALAIHADHIEPHRGDEQKFWSGALQGLCRKCHTAKTLKERKQ